MFVIEVMQKVSRKHCEMTFVILSGLGSGKAGKGLSKDLCEIDSYRFVREAGGCGAVQTLEVPDVQVDLGEILRLVKFRCFSDQAVNDDDEANGGDFSM
jgi:hypothetical protein